jgi:deazaflavin-dependent oxidoreductase (nitroreductase family)
MTSPHEIEAMAVDSPRSWAAAHAQQYLDTEGADVEHPHAECLILLYTRGRKTGTIRRTPLASAVVDGELVVAASQGGAPTDPLWFGNLAADPTVWVRNKGDVYEARAIVLDAEERPAAWKAIVAAVPGMAGYAEKTDRVIPMVRLARV